ncbi:hypothetical protein [Candidatus Frankia nodulisporulans]|uniref:hypothetical protein n=1 Tax=Candidatus Frankia nodulisporulans TaxID=2060052 RepID=UPI0013D0FAC8|nr:hypothetical protein [Candidatus Frankia nodulisporulans]
MPIATWTPAEVTAELDRIDTQVDHYRTCLAAATATDTDFCIVIRDELGALRRWRKEIRTIHPVI